MLPSCALALFFVLSRPEFILCDAARPEENAKTKPSAWQALRNRRSGGHGSLRVELLEEMSTGWRANGGGSEMTARAAPREVTLKPKAPPPALLQAGMV